MSATIRPTRPKPMTTVPGPSSSISTSPASATERLSNCRDTVRPSFASSGVIVSPIAVTVCQNDAVDGRISCACAAVASTISVVSDGLPISSPVSAATPRRELATRRNRNVTTALVATTPVTASSSDGQFCAISRRSRLIPTVIRNTPSASPLNGAVMTSTSL